VPATLTGYVVRFVGNPYAAGSNGQRFSILRLGVYYASAIATW
jgi:hypothetical protein